MNNTAFQKALRTLAHPFSLSAMALLLSNDLLLKRMAPSWLSGKLSDFAVLFFLPFFLAAVLTWITRPITGKRERLAVLTAFLVPGLLFAAVKVVPAANGWTVGTFSGLGFPIQLSLDPSDLLALLVLPAGWALYQHIQRVWPTFDRRVLLLLPLAALLLLGDAAAPDPGVSCISVDTSGLWARAGYNNIYTSSEGGLTWQVTEIPALGSDGCDPDGREIAGKGQEDFRFTPGGPIERSTDGGQTWQSDYRSEPQSEAERAYAMKVLPTNILIQPGPLSGIFDPVSGNVIFAMGHEGVLVRLSNGQYRWAAVGPYDHSRVAAIPLDGYLTLLLGEIFLALIAALLIFATLMLRARHRWWQVSLVVTGWLAWLICAFVFPPAITNGGYGPTMSWMALLATGVWAIIVVVAHGIGVAHEKAFVGWKPVLFALLTGLIFLLPYALWALNLIPAYYLAAGLALLLLALGTIAGMLNRNEQKASSVS